MPKRPRGDRGVSGRYRVTAFSARLKVVKRERDLASQNGNGERAEELGEKIADLERRRDTFRSFTPLPDG
ncbi:MAG TPA: hypothetical protein VJL27_02335 [Patescibacteria group bacterium]|nr:hypothetical protein [Patescibacteria group bacterium]